MPARETLLSKLSGRSVLIIGDDLGWTDLGFIESFRTLETNQGPMPIQDIVLTPNLDSIARSPRTPIGRPSRPPGRAFLRAPRTG